MLRRNITANPLEYAMSAQFNDSFSTFTHQFAAAAARANRLALENAETVFGVQLKTFEQNIDATTAFFSELAETRDLEAYKTLWPKGMQVAKDNTERLVAASQELFGLTLKTSEALGQLAKSQFETATESVQASVAKATKSAKAK
jgi:exonuclease VII small subunit